MTTVTTAIAAGVDLTVSDASGQRKVSITNFPKSATIRDLIKTLRSRMGLSTSDSNGRNVEYQAFSKTNGYHLLNTETVGETLQSGDELSLLPDIQAGLAARRDG